MRKTCRKCGYRFPVPLAEACADLGACRARAALRRTRGALRVAKRGLRLVRGQDRQQADIIAFNTLAEIRLAERAR